MNPRGEKMEMVYPTIIMGVIACVLLVLVYFRGDGGHVEAVKSAGVFFVRLIPLIFFALLISSLVTKLVPQELILKWVGPGSGVKGLILGTVAGFLTPGGPFVCFPLAAGFLAAGAGPGTMISYVTAWSLGALTRIPIEVGFLGPRFVLVHLASTFFFPPFAGWIAEHIFRLIAR